jgi:hypothetical protein
VIILQLVKDAAWGTSFNEITVSSVILFAEYVKIKSFAQLVMTRLCLLMDFAVMRIVFLVIIKNAGLVLMAFYLQGLSVCLVLKSARTAREGSVIK